MKIKNLSDGLELSLLDGDFNRIGLLNVPPTERGLLAFVNYHDGYGLFIKGALGNYYISLNDIKNIIPAKKVNKSMNGIILELDKVNVYLKKTEGVFDNQLIALMHYLLPQISRNHLEAYT